MKNSSLESKFNFIKNEIWILAWAAASQRGNIFSKGISEHERNANRNGVKEKVFRILDECKSLDKLTENFLIQKIKSLSKSSYNNDFKFKIGPSQKLINILLKYYWWLGWIKNEPPHCPIDRIVLSHSKLKINGKIPSWTKMNDIEEYKIYIKHIKKIANPKSIATWELEIFNRRN
jgi:hypothetical protein